MSEAIGVTVSVDKIRRCSDRGSYTADMLSKGNLNEAKRMLPLRGNPLTVPQSIVNWIRDPRIDMEWSKAILMDMENEGMEVITRY